MRKLEAARRNSKMAGCAIAKADMVRVDEPNFLE